MAMPEPAALLPHRRPMLMVSGIDTCDAQRLTARAEVREDNPLLQDGLLPGFAALEMLAQACGLFLGMTQEQQRSQGPGAIVSVRDMRVHVAALALGAQLTVETECLGGSGDAAMFRGKVREGENVVLEATLTVSRFPEGGMR